MKAKVYFKFALKTGVIRKGSANFLVNSASTPFKDNRPLGMQNEYYYKYHPTTMFAIEFDIPDQLFKNCEEAVATVNVAMKKEYVLKATLKDLKK